MEVWDTDERWATASFAVEYQNPISAIIHEFIDKNDALTDIQGEDHRLSRYKDIEWAT